MDINEAERLSKYFSVLQNSLSLRIYAKLRNKSMFVYEIANEFNAATAVISKCLTKLRLIDLVGYSQEETRRKYYLKRDDIYENILKSGDLTRRKTDKI